MLQLACGVCFAVYIGYFLELERAFGCCGAVGTSADIKEVIVAVYFLCQLRDLGAAGDYFCNIRGKDVGKAVSGPAPVYMTASDSRAIAEPTTLMTPSEESPFLRARRSA